MSKLAEILSRKEEQLRARASVLPLADLRAKAADAPPTRGFLAALRTSRHPVSLIAEVKSASPSQGVIRPDFDPMYLARTYEAAGADCLSVLTEPEFFHGSEKDLSQSRASVSVPVLRKDFTTDIYHVYEARAIGADAILLIVAALSRSQLREYREAAESLGLDVLVETHTLEEAVVAVESGATMIGINNRNLATFEVSLEASREIIPTLPAGVHAVSESGLASRHDVDYVHQCGAKSVLIGTAFCSASDVGGKVKSVMGWA